jgi:hypothetical protein
LPTTTKNRSAGKRSGVLADDVEPRVDPDYDPYESMREEVALEVNRYIRSMPPIRENGNGHGFNKWLQAVTAGLIISGVAALIGMEIWNSSRLTALETRIEYIAAQHR